MSPYLRYGICVVVGCVAATMITCVQADTLRGNKESCDNLSAVVVRISELRDAGVPWDIMKANLQESIQRAYGHPNSYIQTEEDVEFILRSMKLLWDKPDMAGVAVARKVYERCMDSAHYPVSKVKMV